MKKIYIKKKNNILKKIFIKICRVLDYEIIDQNKSGYILPIRNIDILKEKINYFYNNPAIRIAMGKNALEKANNFLSWENYGKKMIKFYNTILN